MTSRISTYWAVAFVFIAFNIWHSAVRGVWNGSIKDSLTMSSNVIELAHSVDTDIRIRKPYDGAFLYAMTFDPLIITGKALPYVDVPDYRYKRMLYPLLANLTAFNQPKLFPYSLFFINVIAWILCAIAGWRIAINENLPRFALAFGLLSLTGLTFATFRTLAEPLALALVLWGGYFWRKESKKTAVVFFALAGLARENTLLVPIAATTFGIFKEGLSWRKGAVYLVMSLLPFAIWATYLSHRLPSEGYVYFSRLGFPLMGLIAEGRQIFVFSTTSTEKIRSLSILISVLAITPIVLFNFIRFPTFWGALAATEVLFCSVLRGDIWLYHAGSARIALHIMAFFLIYLMELGRPDTTRDRTNH
ncbi:MAG: hypothetical protein KCHDKBKB_02152 [Elusimicrobia bacterium]|nr:hypothetical protein [Elusimicrobiota bacterium]